MHDVLIDGNWRRAVSPVATFQARNPTTGDALSDTYPVSSMQDIESALAAGQSAAEAMLDMAPAPIVTFLRDYADRIEAHAQELAELAHTETALPVSPRLKDVEIPRTFNQLRLAANAAESQSWRAPVVDKEAKLASVFEPLGGPVLVIGPNNFPFAFNGISGGDFAAAIAAQNPVIVKAHPLHPSTTRRLAELAHEAARKADLPSGAVQMLYDVKPEDGLRLVADSRLGATAFTGSRRAGFALKRAADEAGRPIYLEMSAVNPVFVLPGAIEEKADSFADEYIGSCTLGVGQFCTNPGLLILAGSNKTDALLATLGEKAGAAPAGIMFSQAVAEDAARATQHLLDHGATLLSPDRRGNNTGATFHPLMLTCTAKRFLEQTDALQAEVFGPVGLVIVTDDTDEMLAVARKLAGSLTACVYSATDGSDDATYNQLAPILRPRCGRLLNDKMPTGVAVSPAMNHGGPYPATGHPGFTAVGIPASIRRFTALRAYDNVRPHRLPDGLK